MFHAGARWTFSGRSRSVFHVALTLPRHWTVDDPPKVVRDLVTWYVHEREVGQTIIDYLAWNGEHGGPRLSIAHCRDLMRDERVLALLDRALRTSNAGPLRVQAVMDMLYMRATVREDVKAAQLYLQAVDRLTQRTRVDMVVTDARQLSDEQLYAELSRATKMLEARAAAEPPILDAEVVEQAS